MSRKTETTAAKEEATPALVPKLRFQKGLMQQLFPSPEEVEA